MFFLNDFFYKIVKIYKICLHGRLICWCWIAGASTKSPWLALSITWFFWRLYVYAHLCDIILCVIEKFLFGYFILSKYCFVELYHFKLFVLISSVYSEKPLTRSDLVLNSQQWSQQIIGCISHWLPLESSDDHSRNNAEKVKNEKITWQNK